MTKIAFEQARPIDSKLCRLIFNYPKFHAVSYFVQYICDYISAVYYNTAYSKETHEYLLKTFYNRIKKRNTTCKFGSITFAVPISLQ